MRPSDTLLALTLLLGAGCSGRTELVSIDTYAVPLPPPAPLTKDVAPKVTAPGPVSVRIPGMSARNVMVGSGQELADKAIAEARKNQDLAYRQALNELRLAYRADASTMSSDEKSKARKDFEEKFKEGFAALRTLFDRHAAVVGPLWTRLAVLRGFPLKPGRMRPSAESVFFGRDEVKEADEIKKKIDAEDARYRAEVSRRVEQLRHEWRAIATDLEAKRIVALDEAEQRAEADAKKLVTEILQGLEQSLIKDVQRLPAVPGASVKVDSVQVPKPSFPSPRESVWPERERLEQRAALFARLNGYRLVQPGLGVRDVTKEFMAWDKAQTGR